MKSMTIGGTGLAIPKLFRSLYNQDGEARPGRIGIIGLDTGHGPHFAKILNAEGAGETYGGMQVVAAYPYGSRSIKSSMEMIPDNIATIKKLGVTVVDSIDELLDQVDLVMLETNDGKLHLEQARQVFEAGKPAFIDKPVAASLTDVLTIYKEANQQGVPIFSSSTLRYIKSVQQAANGKIGEVLGAQVFTPAPIEQTHPDLYWYGIHGVEMLFTMLGPKCQTVTRWHTEDADVVVGEWEGGRIGTLRGNRNGTWSFGGQAFGEEQNLELGDFTGYEPLIAPMVSFFQSLESPVDKKETIGIYAFMSAAEVSKKRNGVTVTISEVIEKARTGSLDEELNGHR